MSDGSNPNSRRNFLKSGLIAVSAIALPGNASIAPDAPASPSRPKRFLTEPERRFLESAVDRLIPSDERWPGAAEAGVVNYIDLQRAGAWGVTYQEREPYYYKFECLVGAGGCC